MARTRIGESKTSARRMAGAIGAGTSSGGFRLTEEVEVSAEDWEAYFVKPAEKATPEEHEVAADVFERVRK